MPIPNAEHAVVPPKKLTEYLLNVSHPVGGPNACWFISLGYDPNRLQRLAGDLLEVVRHGDTFSTDSLRFGVKFEVPGRMMTPSGRSVNVVTVWITEPDDPHPRLVTAYPGEEMSNE